MAQTQSQKRLTKALKKCPLQNPWAWLNKSTAFDKGKHHYVLRSNTMPSTVKLYQPVLQAASIYGGEAYAQSCGMNFRLVEKKLGRNPVTFVELGMQDGSSFVVKATKEQVAISIVETDGIHTAAQPFDQMTEQALTAVMLAVLPHVLVIDKDSGSWKIGDAVKTLGAECDMALVNPWTDKNTIPDIAKDSAYYLDAVMTVLEEQMVLNCGEDTSDIPGEIEDPYFQPNAMTGSLLCENLQDGWVPLCVMENGKGKRFGSSCISIADAKMQFAEYSAHRNWSAQEKQLIPSFPDDMPVMPETIRMANRIINTRKDKHPVCNLMWRGVTSYGKSTGVQQLACILNIPLLTLTCHPNMEAREFKSQYVPDAKTEGILLDAQNLTCTKPSPATTQDKPPHFEEALSYVTGLDSGAQANVLNAQRFFSLSVMDPDSAAEMLFGTPLELELDELVWTYTEVAAAIREKPMKAKLAELEALNDSADKKEESSKPEFIHVVSPYLKAMVNGYMVEIQEASRIRDSGVLVSINEFDRPGAQISLMNGYLAKRHKDAICCITDNVGYTSCRPIDPSVLRRQSMIIDSYELSEEFMKDRVKRNTGCTDNGLIDLAYKLWEKVKEFCEQNSITEGSISPTEMERFVQAVMYDGYDSIDYNLDDCIISKATSSIEDQRDIRSACMTLVAGVSI